jgi:hypothetical protein
MSRFIASISLTPTATHDVMTIKAAASGRLKIIEVSVSGLGTSAAAQAIEVERSTGGVTSGGPITPSKLDSTDQAAMAGTVVTTWGTQPTLGANPRPLGFSAFGGANTWQPIGGVFEMRPGEQVSIRAPTGPTYQACIVSVIMDESE